MANKKTKDIDWTALLRSAVTEPGKLSEAYRAFHNYSILNQISAIFQLQIRGIPVGPIATYKQWAEKGRQVRKGSKAIELCLPVSRKFKKKEVDPETGEEREVTINYKKFIFRAYWFAVSQTDGDQEPDFGEAPGWDAAKALQELGITQERFQELDGNIQGYAYKDIVAVNPVAVHPTKTLVHEIAHVLHGHTKSDVHIVDGKDLDVHIRELEAESVALLLCATLEIGCIEESRGYIQHWFDGSEIPAKSVQRIFSVANKILKAGQVAAGALSRPSTSLEAHQKVAA